MAAPSFSVIVPALAWQQNVKMTASIVQVPLALVITTAIVAA